MIEKTHWLKNPNKNYLGHFDLPNGEDIVLTIKTAQWETVKDPSTGKTEQKRVIRFIEHHKWIKPFICNETNAKMILKCINEKYMEDCEGKRIKIGVSKVKVKREEMDCLRVRDIQSSFLDDKKISDSQVLELKEKLETAAKKESEFCLAMKISKVEDLQLVKFEGVIKRLEDIANGNN